MKLENFNNDTTVVIGDMTEKKFGIIANDKMFSILSDKIYSDKIKAPIRELATNAYDAHLAVGKENIPFEVHLPCNEEPYFSVRDFGEGLDAKQIEELYTTYGWSDKSNSNKYVGCMGLGSKSPFAYTDSFELISIKNGMKYIYRCYMEQGIPHVMKFEEYNSDEPSGLLVKFNVKTNDYYDFRNKAIEVYRWFDVIPKFVGKNNDVEINPKYEKIDNVIIDCPSAQGGVVMGNVYYRGWDFLDNYIQSKNINNPQIKRIHNNIHRLILCVDIGMFDISVSRESIAITEKNGKTAYDILVHWQEKRQKEFDDYVNSLHGNLMEQYVFASAKNRFFIDFDKWIESKWIMDFSVGKTTFLRSEIDIRNKYSRHTLNTTFCFPSRFYKLENTKVIFSPVCRRKYIGYVIDNKVPMFVTSEQSIYDKLIEYGFESIHLDDYKYKSDINSTDIRLKMVYNQKNYKYKLIETNDRVADVITKHKVLYYVPFLHNNPLGKTHESLNSVWLCVLMRYFKHRIYIITGKDIEKIKKCPHCYNVLDMVNNIFNTRHGLINSMKRKIGFDFNQSWTDFFLKIRLDNILMPEKIKQINNEYLEYQANKSNSCLTFAERVIYDLMSYNDIHPHKYDLIEYVRKTYPLVEGAFDYNGVKQGLLNEVQNYIYMKEKELKGNK